MSEKDNLQLAEQWIEAVNTQGFDVWGQMRAPGYLWGGPVYQPLRGRTQKMPT